MIPKKSDYSLEREEWEATLRQELKERRELLDLQVLLRAVRGTPMNEKESTFNEERERTAVEQRMKYYRHSPGNHVYIPTIVRTGEITDTAQVDNDEKKRRADINDTRVYLVLNVNDNLVQRSELVPLQWPSFRVDFKMECRLKLLGRPASITCQLFQYQKGWVDKLICEAIFPVPEYGTPPNTLNYEFGYAPIDLIVHALLCCAVLC